VDIHVLQGERSMAKDNMTLGRFRLDGIPPAPRGIPQVEVTFDIDANGILNVTAKDKATGKEQKVTITASTNLDKSEVDRMVKEAVQHKNEDEKRKQLIEARNMGDSIAYQAEKLIKDMGEKISADQKTSVESKTKTLRDAIAGNDLQAIQNATQALQTELQTIGQAAYQQEQAAGQAPDTKTETPPKDDGEDVIEGEFTEA
jgi:molecular chaperone DnaK